MYLRWPGLTGKQVTAVFLAACIGALAGVAIGQAVLVQVADRTLVQYATDLRDFALDVAQTSRNALSEINASSDAMCSEHDLTELRHRAFQSKYLRDAGRIEDGAIVCTALWGRL